MNDIDVYPNNGKVHHEKKAAIYPTRIFPAGISILYI